MSLAGQGGTPNGSSGTQTQTGQQQGQQDGTSGQGPQVQGPNDPLAQSGTQGGAGTQSGTQGTQQQDNGQTDQYAELRGALSREREQRQALERQLRDLQKQGMSDDEKKRLSELEAQNAERDKREKNLILRYEIAARAPKLGIVDPEIAVMLLERDSSVTVGDDGKVVGLDEALKQLVKDKPHLVQRVQQVDAGAGTGGQRTRSGKPTMNDIIRQGARGRAIQQD
jgi:hypothetical protein